MRIKYNNELLTDGSRPMTGNLPLGENQAYSDIPTTMEPTGTTQTVDWDDGHVQVLDLDSASGDVTVTLSNGRGSGSYGLKLIQGSVARNITWPASVLWESGSAPTITTTDDAIDVVTFIYDGVNFIASIAQDLS
jgi:hypothetical protein